MGVDLIGQAISHTSVKVEVLKSPPTGELQHGLCDQLMRWMPLRLWVGVVGMFSSGVYTFSCVRTFFRGLRRPRPSALTPLAVVVEHPHI